MGRSISLATLLHLVEDRTYTITTQTGWAGNHGTDDRIYLTMFDSSANSCNETRINVPDFDDFQVGA